MNVDTILAKNPNAAYRIYDGRATIVLPDHAEVDVLNEIGSRIWDQIDGQRSLGQILESVLEEYDVSPEQGRKDLFEFVATLHQHHMVR
jgi:Coenzyme PQQ synthesis protein D (PqqD)